MTTPRDGFHPESLRRPDPALWRYYLWVSLLTGPAAPLVFVPLWMRYITLQYKLDDSGVSMQWGVLFRREVYLTFRRIQDIHVTRNLLQRWMGLAKISLQTASGSSQAEMVIEGIVDPEPLRDYLYSQMRGAKNEAKESTPLADVSSAGSQEHVTTLLRDIRDALQQLLQQQGKSSES